MSFKITSSICFFEILASETTLDATGMIVVVVIAVIAVCYYYYFLVSSLALQGPCLFWGGPGFFQYELKDDAGIKWKKTPLVSYFLF